MEDCFVFNLSFEGGYFDEEPRKCEYKRRVLLAGSISGMLVNVSPPYSSERYCVNFSEIGFVILAPRSGSDSLFPVSNWPMRVYVYVPLIASPETTETIGRTQILGMGIGVMYPEPSDVLKALAKKQ